MKLCVCYSHSSIVKPLAHVFAKLFPTNISTIYVQTKNHFRGVAVIEMVDTIQTAPNKCLLLSFDTCNTIFHTVLLISLSHYGLN